MAAATTLSTSVPVLQRQNAELVGKLENAQAKNRDLAARSKELLAEYSAKVSQFVRVDGPTAALYGAGGAVIGGLLGYFLFDQIVAYFGPDSKIGLLATAGLGVVAIALTPKLVKVTKKKLENTLPIAAGAYGAAIGLTGVGLVRAWYAWPQEASG